MHEIEDILSIPDQDERDLASMCRSLLTAECPTTLARALKVPGGERMPAGLWKALAAAVVAQGTASGVWLPPARNGSGGGLQIQTGDYAAFVRALPRAARERGITLFEVIPADESLESVFRYLVRRR